jgi:hypothetical protein
VLIQFASVFSEEFLEVWLQSKWENEASVKIETVTLPA